MKNRLIFLFAMIVFNVHAQEFELTNAIVSDSGKTQRTEEQKIASKTITTILKENGIGGSLSLAYTNMGEGNIWYRLFHDMKIHGVNFAEKKYLGGWSIITAANPCSANDESCTKPWWTGRWGAEESLEKELITRIDDSENDETFRASSETDLASNLGCLAAKPLRYGDVDSDGKNELVVILKDSFIIFSSQKAKTIFAVMWDVKDWTTWANLQELGLIEDPTSNHPQYGSTKFYDNGNGTNVGYRGYAKLYFGHFASETSSDILVWRKLYQSRLVKDPIKGFEKKSDTFVHYKLVNGEYKKQTTDTATIKGWLTAKQLTWKKGYPSKSECAGQEGQFIPEMHDVLLNDPEVLQ